MRRSPTRAVLALSAALLAAGPVEAHSAGQAGGRASAAAPREAGGWSSAAAPRSHRGVPGRTASPPVIRPTQNVRIVATPASAWTGQPVRLRVLNAWSGLSADYRWSLHGGAKPLDTGDKPVAHVVFKRPGDHLVAVQIRQGGARLRVAVLISIKPADLRTRSAQTAGKGRREAVAAPAPVPSRASPQAQHTQLPRRARAADPVVAIADFNFAPDSITIHVGDTVTWTNEGPSAHTATAQDGSFNTGVLQKGASASHTFTQAGTFIYICQIHPFMHGTIVVLGGSGTGQPKASLSASPRQRTRDAAAKRGFSTPSRTSGGGPAAATPPRDGASSAATLPMTGLNVYWTALCGLGLVAAGLVLRRRVGRRRYRP